jgi:hypothetical protein
MKYKNKPKGAPATKRLVTMKQVRNKVFGYCMYWGVIYYLPSEAQNEAITRPKDVSKWSLSLKHILSQHKLFARKNKQK